MKVNIMPMILTVDYKDIDMLYMIYIRYFDTINPALAEFVYGTKEPEVNDQDNKEDLSKSQFH